MVARTGSSLFLVAVVSGLVSGVNSGWVSGQSSDSNDFDRSIAPLLANRCLHCHAESEPKGGLNLSTFRAAMMGGDSGKVIEPGSLALSPLWEHIESDKMPPKKPLSMDEKNRIKEWIKSGAVWGQPSIDPLRFSTDHRAGLDWWSFQPIDFTRFDARQTIDALIDTQLEQHGLNRSEEADKRTLIRRLSFDLIGLPPTREQIDLFLSDTAADAYEKLVDRLLASPGYGERWARHWLDIVRFGESNGFEYDEPRENAWHYRNWLIQALNQDMPYDEFVRMQIAGDAIYPDDFGAASAVGFLVAGPHNTTLPSNDKMRMAMSQDELEDLVGNVGQTFLGLTIHCARCHDHKFDPVTQKEYYELAATLACVGHGERKLTLSIPTEIASIQETKSLYTCVSGKPTKTHLLLRGDVGSPAEEVTPNGLRAIKNIDSAFELSKTSTDLERRKKLANWITHPDNPLFARVIANRLWHYHFGQGLVRTPSDLGYNGGIPSHPELLDWLACSLIHADFRMKSIHRLIVCSATYRQSSAVHTDAMKADADNRLLWRRTPQRLDAEVIRDAALFISGKLDQTQGGIGYRDVKHVFYKGSHFYELLHEETSEIPRRTIYRFTPRGGRNPFLDTFDCPDPSSTTPKREATTTPLQSLSLMNNPLVFQLSVALAERITRESPLDTQGQIKSIMAMIYGRPADTVEIDWASELVLQYGLASFCRVLFNSNEFLYVR